MSISGKAEVVAVGECMLELSRDGDGWRLYYGGDTFNTAVYMARSGVSVRYLTAVGDDPWSLGMREAFAAENISHSLVATAPGRLPGLYAIRTDDAGERTFSYWRDQAAVRTLFDIDGIEAKLAAAAAAPVLYLSGITLSLFDASGRRRLVDLARSVRDHGGLVAFDPNYRPAGWRDPGAARCAIEALLPFVTLGLPTHDDERLLHGDEDVRGTLERWRAAGVAEVVVKAGAHGCTVDGPDGAVPIPALKCRAVDTTGAGDSFNAGYLAARLRGATPVQAAAWGNRLAAVVVGHPGAIIPAAAMPLFEANAIG